MIKILCLGLFLLLQTGLNENIEIKFLGWSSDSNEFGYLVNKEVIDSNRESVKKSIYFIKKIAPKGKLSDVTIKSGNVIKHIKTWVM